MKVMIIDGYVDEPACLGVDPYISPYPRYIAGALIDAGLSKNSINYTTIDHLRVYPENTKDWIVNSDILIIIAGSTVPGKYLNATPISENEIRSLFRASKGIKLLGGPVHLGLSKEGGSVAKSIDVETDNFLLVKGDIEAFVFDLIKYETKNEISNIDFRLRTNEEISRWSCIGAYLPILHPKFPHIVAEIETYRGCARKSYCDFCTEHFYGEPYFRQIEDVVSEIKSLYEQGTLHFRLGRQPDLFGYHARETSERMPKPQPEMINKLYKGIRSVAPKLKTLHMDNVNPATIAQYPDESLEIMKTIIQYHTPGDVAAIGMESADPVVIKANNLKADPDDVFFAIKLINSVGKIRGYNGLPEFLPGLNIVHGLAGESKKTFQLNYEFLQRVLENDYYLRRINIRQVIAFPGTPIYNKKKKLNKNKKLFMQYKELIRNKIDLPMLKKVVPAGTILKDVICEESHDNFTLARQLGTYPLIVKIPIKYPVGKVLDVTIFSHKPRALHGLPYPLNVNRSTLNLIRKIPGVTEKQAINITSSRPYTSKNDLLRKIGEDHNDFIKYISI